MQFYTIQPCKTTSAIECVPKKQLSLNLDKLEQNFKDKNYDVLNVKVMLIVKKENEITVYKSGRLLIKTDNKKIAKKCAKEVYGILKNIL